ncbi:MAG: Ig-like domain-containing protein [Patescibacteria group bacterium]
MKKLPQLLIGLLLLVAIPVTIFLAGQRQEIRKKAAPATTMAIIPASITKKVDDVFTVEVTIDTGENQIVAIELHITFDETKLEAKTITNGSLFPNVLASGTIEPGAGSITVGAADAKEPVRGVGTVATITFQAKEKTDAPAAIRFASNTFVGGLSEGATNVLVGTTPSSVTIANSIVQNTLTTTPSPTLTITPSKPASQSSPSGEATTTPTATPTTAVTTQLSIVSPVANDTATTHKPTIQGKAVPGSTITVTVYSTPQTVTLTADANGNWSFTPDAPLEAGPHNIVVSTTDQSGQTQTATAAFVVAASDIQIGGSESTIPVSGTMENTLLLILIGIAFILMGVVIPALSSI